MLLGLGFLLVHYFTSITIEFYLLVFLPRHSVAWAPSAILQSVFGFSPLSSITKCGRSFFRII